MMRMVGPGGDAVGLVLDQSAVVRDRYRRLRGDECADSLFRRVKAHLCWYLVSRRHFDRSTALVHRELMAAELGFDIPVNVVEAGLV